jgi:subtilisin family serine protease
VASGRAALGRAAGAGGQFRAASRILEAIAGALSGGAQARSEAEIEEEVAVLGATWGLKACRVPQSTRSGAGIRVAVLTTGLDLGHPDFAGRQITTATFVGQPVQDIHGHGTHMTGTACGTRTPPGNTERYGIGYQTSIFIGKVLTNSGASVGGSILNGMNWAVANKCPVIYLAFGGGGGPFAFYTAAGQAALNAGCLMIASAGSNFPGTVAAPANSPTIMAVGALNKDLTPAAFSPSGDIDVAAPGRDNLSSLPRPTLYGVYSGGATAGAHAAGCAALWAQTSASLRGVALWRLLQSSARPLPFPPTRVGAGLVQAPA